MRTAAIALGVALLTAGCGPAEPPAQDGATATPSAPSTAPAPQGAPPSTAPGTPIRTSSPADHYKAPGFILHQGPWDTDARRRTLAELRDAGRSSAGGEDVDPLVFVDGKRLPRGSNLVGLPVKDVEAVMGTTALTRFGQRANGGVLVVTTKDTTGGR